VQVNDCTVKLQRADKLIGGLGGERVRWQATVDQLGQDLINVIGDVVIAAGSIAYSGGAAVWMPSADALQERHMR
jgi:dynein heavy chain